VLSDKSPVFKNIDLESCLIPKQKKIAETVYRLLKLDCEDVNLLGGAPRDWYINKNATDLDFFIHEPIISKEDLIKGLHNLFHTAVHDMNAPQYMDFVPNPAILGVCCFEIKHQQVQVINLNCPTWDYFRYFPLNVSQCKWDFRSKTVIGTEAFYSGHAKKELRVCDTLYGLADKYKEKIVSKYNQWGYKFIE
jgi:hypothetical protein